MTEHQDAGTHSQLAERCTARTRGWKIAGAVLCLVVLLTGWLLAVLLVFMHWQPQNAILPAVVLGVMGLLCLAGTYELYFQAPVRIRLRDHSPSPGERQRLLGYFGGMVLLGILGIGWTGLCADILATGRVPDPSSSVLAFHVGVAARIVAALVAGAAGLACLVAARRRYIQSSVRIRLQEHSPSRKDCRMLLGYFGGLTILGLLGLGLVTAALPLAVNGHLG